MSKKIEKLFKSYREQLLHLAKLYGVVEIKSYARSSKRLTISQLELLLIKNHIKLPVNRSSDKAIAKQELKQNSITNAYLSLFVIFFIGCLVLTRPYIKKVVNEVKFTYVAEEYKSKEITKSKKLKKKKSGTKIEKKSEVVKEEYDNTVSLNAETTSNLFDDLGYVDVFRKLNSEEEQYTWWSNRGQAWAKNVGWRIDYQVASPGIASKAHSTSIFKNQRFSDHAPLIVEYNEEI